MKEVFLVYKEYRLIGICLVQKLSEESNNFINIERPPYTIMQIKKIPKEQFRNDGELH